MSGPKEAFTQGITKRCRLSWLTNSDLVYELKCGGSGGVAGSQPMSTVVHRSPNKLWRSKSIFNLCFYYSRGMWDGAKSSPMFRGAKLYVSVDLSL